ncbi:hypothetical protein R3P38DRAFT_2586128, partial [Favolaschia claudopus]
LPPAVPMRLRPSPPPPPPPAALTRRIRSTSPAAGDKRARSPSDDLRVVQAQRTSTTSRPKAHDFDDITQEALAVAIKVYRCFCAGRHAFPDHTLEVSWVCEAWALACRKVNINMELTPTLTKLITKRGTHLRGEVKTKARPIVELQFGFKRVYINGQNKSTIKHNRDWAEELTTDLTFTFLDPKARKGMYKSTAIQKLTNAVFFANRRDEGPTFPEYFNPFPKPAMALILTALHNSIDEWNTGIRADTPFTANEYRDVYEKHLKALNKFDSHTAKYAILPSIQARLYNTGRFHSGAEPLVFPKPDIRMSDLEAAIEEFDEDATDTEGEYGAGSDEDN